MSYGKLLSVKSTGLGAFNELWKITLSEIYWVGGI